MIKIGKHEIGGTACIIGILNVTPDSFSDSSSYTPIKNTFAQAEKMIATGVKIINVGGESAHPGYTSAEVEEEINHVVPVIRVLKERFDILVSIDTHKIGIARVALEVGIDILDGVWASLYDGKILALTAEKSVPIISMHNQEEEKYDNIIKEVCNFLIERAQVALNTGIALENIRIDPELGSVKNETQSTELLKGLDAVCKLGYSVFFGISCKRTVDYLPGGGTLATDRGMEIAALSAWVVTKGCQIVHIYNIDVNRDTVKVVS